MSTTTFPASRGPLLILTATAIGGGSGYVLMLVAGAVLGAEAYAPFGVFWSVLFFVVGALSGLQQEVARATSPREPGSPARPVTRDVALGLALVAIVATLATSPWWAVALFGAGGAAFVGPLAVGFAGYVVVTSIVGTLYGIDRIGLVSVMIAADGVVRLVACGLVLALGGGLTALAWAVVAPFVVVPVAVWIAARARFVDRATVDVGRRRLALNAASTIAGSAAAGVLVSGFPAVLAATSPGVDAAVLGALILVINGSRAPLIIVLISLQSLLVVRFRGRERAVRLMLAIVGIVLAATGVLTIAFAAAGPWLVDLILGEQVAGWVVAGVVASGGLVGVLCVASALAVARGRHDLYTAAWAVAAATAVVMLLVPGTVELRMVASLLVAPVAGTALLAVAAAVVVRRRQASASDD